MAAKLCVVVVEEPFHSRLFDGAVHAFDLSVDPRMLGLGQAMVDVVLGASKLEGMGSEPLAPRCIANLMSDATEALFPGVVKWMLLSVSAVWIV